MIRLIDTSSLKWAYLDGFKLTRRCRNRITRDAGSLYIAEITTVEIVSSLASLHRTGDISVATAVRANLRFMEDLEKGRLLVEPLSTAGLIACRDLLAAVGLRAARGLKTQDAMVAQTARSLAYRTGAEVELITSDHKLAQVVGQLSAFQGLVRPKFLQP
jgi:predicted nucleic acid-binding protein